MEERGGIVVKTAADYQHLRIRSRRPFAKRYSNQPVYILLFEHVVGFRTSFPVPDQKYNKVQI